MRAYRFVAAARNEWLYPEKRIPSQYWDRLGNGYLLMPDPRSVSFTSGIVIGYDDKRSDAYDAYGRKPWQRGYKNKDEHDKEWETFQAFNGEFARVFGPRRRGISFEFGRLDNVEDSAEVHSSHLRLEHIYAKNRYQH